MADIDPRIRLLRLQLLRAYLREEPVNDKRHLLALANNAEMGHTITRVALADFPSARIDQFPSGLWGVWVDLTEYERWVAANV